MKKSTIKKIEALAGLPLSEMSPGNFAMRMRQYDQSQVPDECKLPYERYGYWVNFHKAVV